MKAKYILSMAVAACMGLASCSDFLTEDPKGQLTPGNFFATQENLDASVYALYFNVQQSQCNSNPLIPQCQGDDMTSTTGSNKAAYLSADAFEDPTDTKGLKNSWKWSYNIIQAANLVIENAPKVETSQEEINEAMGQAYFWRAYAYFNLVRLYGPLPVNLKNEPDNNQTVPSPVSEIYSLIVDDLLSAEACNLPAQYGKDPKRIGNMNVYVSQQAVKATLAAVYMAMAGYPLNLGVDYYEKAADKAKEVVDGVNNGIYPDGLLTDWADVYSYGNNHSKECMLGITYRSNTGGWSNFDSQFTSCHQSGKVQGGWGDFLAERYFWSRMGDGPRKNYVYAQKIRLNNGVCVDWWATTDGGKYNGTNAAAPDFRPMFVGFTLNSGSNGPAEAPYDYTAPFWGGMCANKTHQLIRYSEVICWFAEAAARSGKHVAQATQELQKVMQRAYTTVPAITDLAQQALDEHGFEVAGNAYSMVTRRADQFRMDILKEAYDYRVGPQLTVLVPAGTLTSSVDVDGNAFEYTTSEPTVVAENMPVTAPWRGASSMYMPYPPEEVAKNPNLHR